MCLSIGMSYSCHAQRLACLYQWCLVVSARESGLRCLGGQLLLCTVCKSALLLHCALLSENCGRQHNEQGLHVGDSRLHVYKSRLHVGDSRLHVDHSRLHVDNSRLHVGDSSLHVRRQE